MSFPSGGLEHLRVPGPFREINLLKDSYPLLHISYILHIHTECDNESYLRASGSDRTVVCQFLEYILTSVCGAVGKKSLSRC